MKIEERKKKLTAMFEDALDILLFLAAVLQVYLLQTHPDKVMSAEAMAEIASVAAAARFVARRMIKNAVDLILDKKLEAKEPDGEVDRESGEAGVTGKFTRPDIGKDDG